MLCCASVHAADLIVHIEGAQPNATLYLALVPAAQKQWRPALYELRQNQPLFHLKDLPAGRYAIEVFQDSNDDGVLALSPRGIPKEPVGFSSNPSLFAGKPTPDKSQFEHGLEDNRINIRLNTKHAKQKSSPSIGGRASER